MAYFATFYSYKGGVGRTLALANVAWLLANHPTEPARVLVVDFDLGAPGLYQVFGMVGAKRFPGLVDYVTSYVQKAEIPNVAQFIHKTAYENIDIIQAGKMDSRYQRRLESIDWRALYEGAFGYELIERLKSDVSAIKPEYDYVLIDSLTGYTDVGGICVNQLPDLLILLFRLNQQNLDGIEKVHLNATSAHGEESKKSVIPVITPSWPFIDNAAALWINKVREIFGENQLLEISFDSSLSFGERIVSQEANKLPFASKLLEDYRRLAEHIREKNPVDCLTIWNSIRPGSPQVLADTAGLYLTLLTRRPQVLEYWRGLSTVNHYTWLRHGIRESVQPWERLKAFIEQESENLNKFALLARARMYGEKDRESSRSKAIADLDRALQIDPSFVDALLDRGRIAYEQRRYEDAVRDFSRCLEIRPKEDDFPRSKIEAELAGVYLRMFNGKEALRTIGSAKERDGADLDLCRIRARAFYLEGNYPSALADARRIAKLNLVGEANSLLPSQILAAMGNIGEAAKELQAFFDENRRESDANLAEAYLAVDPRKTIALLEGHSIKISLGVRSLLTRLAHIFSGEPLAGDVPESGSKKPPRIDKNESWSFFEVVALLRAKERAGQLSAEAIQLAYDIIQSAADATEFSLIQRSRVALGATEIN